MILFFIVIGSTHAAQDLFLPGQQAEAYAQANDSEQSAEIYDKILKLTLPEWQKAIALYDLGTARLNLDQIETAYQLFQEIKKGDVSSPWLLRDLELNIALSSLLAAKNSAASLQEGAILESPDLLSQVQSAIHHLKVADALNCLINRLEITSDATIQCSPPSYIIVPLQQAYRLMGELKTRLLRDLSASEKNSLLLLIDGLGSLAEKLKKQSDIKQYVPYFYYQASTLLPLWDKLKKEKQSKEKFDQLMIDLAEGHIDQVFEQANAIEKQLGAKLGEHSIDSLILDYQLLLFTEPLFTQKLQSLLALQKQIKPEEKQKEAFELSRDFIEKAISLNDQGQADSGRFYLAAALSQVQATNFKQSTDDPIIVLENALAAERSALQLNHLYSIAPEKDRNLEMQQIVTKAQQKVVEIVPQFVTAVLIKEQSLFKNKECQNTPWNQAIPLFDKGSREAKGANALFATIPPSSEAALDNQTATIKYWKEVLRMLKNPPSKSQVPKQPEVQPKSIDQAPNNPEDTLLLLQEMQLQDKKDNWQMPKEFKSW